jgi:DNA-binding GntR family transcriptional regulator
MRPRSSAQNVYELLKRDIVSGVLKPGNAIREAELAASLGLSRTPVREALLRLANLGLIEIFPQSGTRVAPIRLEKVRAAQLIRQAVEVEVVRRACGTVADEQIQALRHILEDQAVAVRRGDAARSVELDEAFHAAIYAVAGFPAVAAELEDVRVHLDRLRYAAPGWPRPAAQIVAEHEAILTALAERDEDRAAEAMVTHLGAVLPVLDAVAGQT